VRDEEKESEESITGRSHLRAARKIAASPDLCESDA
jgi:hypothetical protein